MKRRESLSGGTAADSLKPSLLPAITADDIKLSARLLAATLIVYGGVNASFRTAEIKTGVIRGDRCSGRAKTCGG